MRRLFYLCLFFLSFLSVVKAESFRYTGRSVLETGKWVKIRVAENGIYKLSLSELKKMGFSDIRKVAIYGYGGWPLDEDFSHPYTDDLPEIAVWKAADFLLFYGKGTRKWEYTDTEGFVHANNPYSDYGYYFVTEKDTDGKLMEKKASEEGATLQINTFDDYYVHDQDLVSVNKSGRELFGESFESVLSRDFPVAIPGITDEEGYATLRFISKAISGPSAVTLSIDGKELINERIARSVFSGNDEYKMALVAHKRGRWEGTKKENLKVNIAYSTTGHRNVHLDYFRLHVKRELKAYGPYTFFRSLSARGNASRFVIQGTNEQTLVFDVTDGNNPLLMETVRNGAVLSFSIPASTGLREFAVVQPEKISAPEVIGEINNQNLHALPQQQMVIIAPPAFTTQAERLAEAHRQKDGLSVKVVAPEEIYNEFSSGTPDATAYRRFMKMFYDRQTSEQDAPRYLLLFGDGAYDNRGKTAVWKAIDMRNMLLTYQTQESLNQTSFVIDDYFAFLDDADNDKPLHLKKVNLAIGRLPVRTVEQAAYGVDKIIGYMENKEAGTWKNTLCFVADDGNNVDKFNTIHMSQADLLATYMEENHSGFLINKLYFDAYKKDLTGGKNSYPDVRAGLQKLLKDGLLLVNYTGHGNTVSWSDEKILTQTDIKQFSYKHLPIWITATCDFTRFDDSETSAGEDVFLNRFSGGIALFTTVRVAYAHSNLAVNEKLIQRLFQQTNGKRLTLGEALQTMKNELFFTEKSGFCLIGDPALKPAYPEQPMRITTINGQSADKEIVSFKALEKIEINGEVLKTDGTVDTDFNGTVYPVVKDSKTTVTCLNNNKTTHAPFTFSDYTNTLFVGNGVVKNGLFSFSFTVPKDISYSNKEGKISLYAVDREKGNEAQGSFHRFVVGGSSHTAESDTIGPEVRALYLNDTTFVEGGKVNNTPFFVARLWDWSGVNISGNSVGHDMMLIIDSSTVSSYNLNNYYELIPEEEGSGIVKFAIPALPPGMHSAEFWVWDIRNNSTKRTFSFEVVPHLKPQLIDVVATPSPAREQVTFHFTHNRPETYLTVGIQLYDLAGRLIWKHEENGSSELFTDYKVTWNLKTSSGSKVAPGIYLYRAAIRSDQSQEATKGKKILILR